MFSSRTQSKSTGFTIMPFGADGEQVGKGFWEFAKLSSKWVAVCRTHLHENGSSFDTVWSKNLSHIRTKFTSASGSAMATFFVNNHIASSILLLSGLSPLAESEITTLFVESLQKTTVIEIADRESIPFESINATTDRPLMIVVPWPNRDVSKIDSDLVRELGVHLAGAFFSTLDMSDAGV